MTDFAERAKYYEWEYGLPLVDMNDFDLNAIPEKAINKQLIESYKVLPLYEQDDILFIAISDPANQGAVEDFRFSTGMQTEPVLVEEDKLERAIEQVLSGGLNSFEGFDEQFGELEVIDESPLDDTITTDEAEDAPVVRFLNQVLIQSIQKGASDIHFEPFEKIYKIRIRIDGILHELAKPPVKQAPRISARLKVLSRLDIAERRIPQDGRTKIKLPDGRAIDMRVSTLPTLYGEKVVIRILDSSAASLDIEQLGMTAHQKSLYLSAIQKPQGLILVTGPTGSGKTVSLYTGLNILNETERNISTAEDPVEINLVGVNQVQINTKTGLDFASALRSFLRQDPDIIMVGEIRDLETAEIAVKAAQTGHLVLSTLHTNSTAETLTRLMNMGVPTYNIASSVTLILAQRLARRLCPHCKAPETVPLEQLKELGFTDEMLQEETTQIFRPVGCDRCSGGYKGRVGVYEMMSINDEISKAMMEGTNAIEINKIAIRAGMSTLRNSALKLAQQGVTSLTEVERVTLY